MEVLLHWDAVLFEVVNQGMQNPLFDWLLPMWRNKYFWLPVYVFLVSFLLINFSRKGLYIILFALLTIAIADSLCSAVLKKSIKRLRPCKTEHVSEYQHLLVPCGSGYSFPSAHATNHFALAVFLIGVAGARFSRIKLPLLLWAASIAFAQVYVGVHFPLDVLAGACLGIVIGSATSSFFNILWRSQNT